MKDLSDHPGLEYDDLHIKISDESTPGATAGGTAAAARRTINKVFEEERFHAQQGHGFAAERANDFYDRVHGHDAKIVGDDNAKNTRHESPIPRHNVQLDVLGKKERRMVVCIT